MCSIAARRGLVAAQFSLLFEKPGLMMEINRLLGGGDVALDVLRDALCAGSQRRDAASLLPHDAAGSRRAIWDMSVFSLPNLNAMAKPPLLVLGAEGCALMPAFLVQSDGPHLWRAGQDLPGMGHGVMLEKVAARRGNHPRLAGQR